MSHFDLAIVGGGIAGASLAHQASLQGMSVGVIDDALEGCASNAPLALLHLFQGRSLDVDPDRIAAFELAVAWLRAFAAAPTQAQSPGIRETTIVRPLDAKQGRRLSQTFERCGPTLARQGYPIDRLNQAGLDDRYPAIASTTAGALHYGPAFAVHLARYRAWHLQVASQRGCIQLKGSVSRLERCGLHWQLVSPTLDVAAEMVVLAPGAHLGSWFPDLDLRVIGGEVASFASTTALDVMVSASGTYVGRAPDGDIHVGATRWDWDDRVRRTDAIAIEELQTRAAQLVPALADAQPSHVWRGVRAVFPSGKQDPLVGPVPGFPGLYVLGVFGGKGLLWHAMAATSILEAIATGATPSPLIRASRIAGKWRSPIVSANP